MSLRQTGQPSVSPVLIVWVGVRALTGTDIRRLILTDLDLSLQTVIARADGAVAHRLSFTYRRAGAGHRNGTADGRRLVIPRNNGVRGTY